MLSDHILVPVAGILREGQHNRLCIASPSSRFIAREPVSNTHIPIVATWNEVSLDIYAAFDCIVLSFLTNHHCILLFRSLCSHSNHPQRTSQSTALKSMLHSHLLMQSKSMGLVSTL